MAASICGFGDSIMKGVIFDAIRGRYTILKNSFARIISHRPGLTVENHAKFGCTIKAGREIIDKYAGSLADYKYIALEFGGNDCDFNWAEVSANPDTEHLPNTPIAEFEAEYCEIIDKVAESGSKPVIFSLPPLDAQKYFTWISKNLNPRNILKWLGDIEHIYRWHEMYNLTVVRLAAIKNVTLIDIRKAFLESRAFPRLLCEDGIHPSEEGHALISKVISGYSYALT